MTPADLEHNFRHHPPRGAKTAEAHAEVREQAKAFAQAVDRLLPAEAVRERALALTKVEEAMFWANAGIARHSR